MLHSKLFDRRVVDPKSFISYHFGYSTLNEEDNENINILNELQLFFVFACKSGGWPLGSRTPNIVVVLNLKLCDFRFLLIPL